MKRCPDHIRQKALNEGVSLSELGRRGAAKANRLRQERKTKVLIFNAEEEEDETYVQSDMFARRAH